MGINYSPLVCLSDEHATDSASSCVSKWIKSSADANCNGQALSGLLHVVGELHDNVWSHGKSTGYSMAQKWPQGEIRYLEFALADRGLGFKREMERVGKTPSSHAEAIEWCIQEGNSTKHGDNESEWAQRAPEDIIGPTPYGPQTQVTFNQGNHHQGLGLHQLKELVKKYSGQLQICSGDCIYTLDELGQESYLGGIPYWQGTAISCRLSEYALNAYHDNTVEPAVALLIDRLKNAKEGG